MSYRTSLYKKRIIKELYFGNTLSCAELSAAIDKSLPLTTRLLNELIDEGFVTETGHAVSTGGRRPVMYSIKDDTLYIVSVAMDQFVTRIAIMDMRNKFVTDIEKFELSLPRNPDALNILTDKIGEFVRQSGILKEKIVGIGIGMPGFVDFKKGVNYSFLNVEAESITEHISSQTGLPTFIDNDSSLIALAELCFGAAKGRKNAMVVNLGWGIGLGMVLNKELFRGQDGFAGEFSHIPMFTNGKLCSCGKSGCLETESSLLYIVAKAQEGLRAGRTSILKSSQLEHYESASQSIIAAVHKGDTFAVELLSEAGYTIGRGVAILIHILNPEIIILSGRASNAGKIWQAPIQHALNEHCIPRLAANTIIEMSTLGYDAELIGAAALVMEHYEKDITKGIEMKPGEGYLSTN
ncbi:MAG TPA: ROK family protein [Chitinophagaceae bacterium]|nr:ROK family protein [Chitinophagaceae bacterium]